MRNRAWLCVALAAILGALAWGIWPAREPVYQGARVSFWIDLPGYDASQFGFFPKVDSNAIPFLVKALRRQTGSLPGIYAKAYNVSPAWLQRRLRAPREYSDWMVRANASELLGRVGTNSPAALTGLLRVLKQEKNAVVKVYAVESLQKIGAGNDAAETGIIEALHDKAPEVRDAAQDALRKLDPVKAKGLVK